ncbi:MAG: hypothetical protein ACK4E0_06555 [Chitinophagaceae bacterium]
MGLSVVWKNSLFSWLGRILPINSVVENSTPTRRAWLQSTAVCRAELTGTTIEALAMPGAVVLIVDSRNSEVLYRLPLSKKAAMSLNYSENGQFLFASDESGNRFIWLVDAGYASVPWRFQSLVLYKEDQSAQLKWLQTNSINKKAI